MQSWIFATFLFLISRKMSRCDCRKKGWIYIFRRLIFRFSISHNPMSKWSVALKIDTCRSQILCVGGHCEARLWYCLIMWQSNSVRYNKNKKGIGLQHCDCRNRLSLKKLRNISEVQKYGCQCPPCIDIHIWLWNKLAVT